jgi:hypothetical protein
MFRWHALWTLTTSAAITGTGHAANCDATFGVYNTSAITTSFWESLGDDLQQALGVCGYDRISWNGPSECAACFSDLSETAQKAVINFGTDGDCYDQSMKAMGFDCKPNSAATKRPDGIECDASTGVFVTSVPEEEVPWDKLSSKMQAAAVTCGYTKRSWDGPSECRACFADLSETKKRAVLSLGTDEQCWNRAFEKFGIDCNQVMTMPKANRFLVYSGLSKAQQKFQIHRQVRYTSSESMFPSYILKDCAVLVGAVAVSLVLLSIASRSAVKLDQHMKPCTQQHATKEQSSEAEQGSYMLVSLMDPETL